MRARPGRPIRRSPLDRFVYVLLVGFVLVTLGPALLGRGALIDIDILTRYLPFQAIDGRSSAPFINMRGDTVDYYLPGIAAIKEAFLAGDFPTWAPFEVGGVPLASLPNHAALSPLSLPYFLLPLWIAPAFVKLGEFIVAIGGMVAFLGRHGVSRGAGVLAGILFASSGFMIMWTNWPHTRVAAFIPLLFWAIERLIQERRNTDVVVIAAVIASMLFGGFPAVTVFTLTVAGCYALARVWALYGPHPHAILPVLGRAAGGVMLGLGLAAVQILPFVLYLDHLGLGERDFGGDHLPLALFITTIVPDAVGLDVNRSPHFGPVNAIEAVGFIGAAAIVLAVTALVLRVPSGAASDRSPRWFLAIAAGIFGTAIWVGGPVLSALQQLPFYSTNFIGRARSVFGFLVAALAGIGFERLLRYVSLMPRESDPGSQNRPASTAARIARYLPPIALLVGITVLGIAVIDAAYEYAAAENRTTHLLRTVWIPALLVALTVAGVGMIRFGPRMLRPAHPTIAAGIALLVVAQSTAFAHTMLPLNDRANLYPVTPTHAFLHAHIGQDRYASGNGMMYPPTSDYYKLRTPVGHEFPDPRWKDVLAAVDPRVARSTTFIRFFTDMPPAGSSALLDQLAVRYWVATPSQVVGRVDGTSQASESVRAEPVERLRCEIPGGALRGVEFEVTDPQSAPTGGRGLAHVAVHTPNGILTGERLLVGGLAPGPQRVAVAGEGLPAGGSYTVDLWFTGVSGAIPLAGSDGQPSCEAVRPVADGLKLVSVEAGANVYERLDALPRIRWASRSEVVPDATQRVELLKGGIADDTVLVEDANAPAADGGHAVVRTTRDEPETIVARIRADRAGYLVVADAVVQDGWSVTVDGQNADLTHGNHAFAAVWVPSGEHLVELSYTAPGLRAGAAISAASIVVSGVLLLPVLRRRRARGSIQELRGDK